MKKIILWSLYFMTPLCLLAQQKAVEDHLLALGFDPNFLDQTDDKVHYSFDALLTIHSEAEGTDGSSETQTYSYHPKRKPYHYVLESCNGAKPTREKIDQFNKDHNGDESSADMGKPDPKSMKILKENDSSMVIFFKYLKSSLPHKYKFLKDCEGEIYLDKINKRLTEIKFYNTKPLRIKIFKATKLELIQYLDYMPETNSYVVREESMDLYIKLFGSIIKMNESTVYSNYKMVK